jgi:hypothetical protein
MMDIGFIDFDHRGAVVDVKEGNVLRSSRYVGTIDVWIITDFCNPCKILSQ